ncbi:MAG: 2-oxo acid dehydrogenase subunit E2 [Clostridiales bacterium]|nr:2-oxo acid dehydrogenase subunit E2 [Clostridiales bacterium]
MAYQLLLPKFGMAMEAAKIIEWKKDIGDYIEKEEAVVVVENEKLTNEIVSMESGVLLRKVALEGETYQVGELLAYLGKEGEKVTEPPAGQGAAAAAASREAASSAAGAATQGVVSVGDAAVAAASPASGSSQGKRVPASPLAKKLAAQLGLDIGAIVGSGPGGRVEKADVEKYAASRKSAAPAVQPGQAGQSPTAPPAPTEAPASFSAATPASQPTGSAYSEIPYTGMRQAVGANMLKAWATVPMVTHHVTVDAGWIQDLRASMNAGVEDKSARVTVNDFLLKLTAAALVKTPAVNSSLQGDKIRVYNYVGLGMATALADGLIVPVIHDADKKSLLRISGEAKDLAARAREGRLRPDDVSGGTFTVTNLGGYGSVDGFTPIVNPPQAAILGVGRIADTPAVYRGEIQARPMMTLSFTYDHRVIDGAVAAEFIKILMDFIENPLRVICE